MNCSLVFQLQYRSVTPKYVYIRVYACCHLNSVYAVPTLKTVSDMSALLIHLLFSIRVALKRRRYFHFVSFSLTTHFTLLKIISLRIKSVIENQGSR